MKLLLGPVLPRIASLIVLSRLMVAFLSEANSNGRSDVFIRDISAGTTTKVSSDFDGAEFTVELIDPLISADGGVISFRTHASNLLPGDTNEKQDIYVLRARP
jgi:Tol biopolymer transport system component